MSVKICFYVLVLLLLMIQSACSSLSGSSSTNGSWSGVGWHDMGFHPSGDSSAVVNLIATDKYLVALTIQGKIYSSPIGSQKWSEIQRPKATYARLPETGKPGSLAVFGDKVYVVFSFYEGVIQDSTMRHHLDSLLWVIDPSSLSITPVKVPDSSLWCPDNKPLPYTCNAEAVYNWNGSMVLGLHAEKPGDSTVTMSRTNVFISSDMGKTWKQTSNYSIPCSTCISPSLSNRVNNDVYGFISTSKGLYSSTINRGILALSGDKWDTIPLATGKIMPIEGFPGIQVLNDTIYALDHFAEMSYLNVSNGSWSIVSGIGYESVLDTACGYLFMSNQLLRWDPILHKQVNLIDTNNTLVKVDVKNLYPPSTKAAYKILRVGDTLYAGLGSGDSFAKGYVYELSLRESPWCKSAWDRRDTNIVRAK